jgi:hypothetical protein
MNIHYTINWRIVKGNIFYVTDCCWYVGTDSTIFAWGEEEACTNDGSTFWTGEP